MSINEMPLEEFIYSPDTVAMILRSELITRAFMKRHPNVMGFVLSLICQRISSNWVTKYGQPRLGQRSVVAPFNLALFHGLRLECEQ